MRKAYKPLARVEKTSHMFGRKTLNIDDYLDVKVDEDNIENIDDYWSTAASVIGNSTIESIDNESTTEPSDTLFNIQNIRKSIKDDKSTPNDKVEDLYKKSIDENVKKAKLKKIVTSSEDESLVKITDDISISDSIEKKEYEPNIDTSIGFEIDHSIILNDEIKENANNMNIQPENKGEEMLKTFTQAYDLPKETPNPKRKRKTTQENTKMDKKTSPSRSLIDIGEAEIKSKNNVISPVVCSASFDVATMSLDYLAFVRNHKTDHSFSIFVISGIVDIEVNGKTKTARKGTVVVVEKDDVYSVDCISTSGAVLLLTYAL